MNELIKLENITKIYNKGKDNEVTALKDINLEILKDDFLTIIGPSGCGKSTLLNILGLLDQPTEGEVYFERKNVLTLSENELAEIRRDKVGFIFQRFNLIPSLTAKENIMFPMQLLKTNKDEKEKRADHLLELVGLGERKSHLPTQLSGGERQRVSIARALVNEPKIILADEPTGNLDTKTGAEIINLMKDLYEKGHTFVVVTHDRMITRVAKRAIGIRNGKLIRQD